MALHAEVELRHELGVAEHARQLRAEQVQAGQVQVVEGVLERGGQGGGGHEEEDGVQVGVVADDGQAVERRARGQERREVGVRIEAGHRLARQGCVHRQGGARGLDVLEHGHGQGGLPPVITRCHVAEDGVGFGGWGGPGGGGGGGEGGAPAGGQAGEEGEVGGGGCHEHGVGQLHHQPTDAVRYPPPPTLTLQLEKGGGRELAGGAGRGADLAQAEGPRDVGLLVRVGLRDDVQVHDVLRRLDVDVRGRRVGAGERERGGGGVEGGGRGEGKGEGEGRGGEGVRGEGQEVGEGWGGGGSGGGGETGGGGGGGGQSGRRGGGEEVRGSYV